MFSCLGDALLNFNLFPHGMAAFTIAQIFYINAFGFKPLKLWIAVLLFIPGLLSNKISFFLFPQLNFGFISCLDIKLKYK